MCESDRCVLYTQQLEYRMQNTKYRMQNTKYRIQNTKYRIQNTEYRITESIPHLNRGANELRLVLLPLLGTKKSYLECPIMKS